jgi:hypothetical protein
MFEERWLGPSGMGQPRGLMDLDRRHIFERNAEEIVEKRKE